MKGRKIIAAHWIRNKAWEIPARERNVALIRMNDWLERQS